MLEQLRENLRLTQARRDQAAASLDGVMKEVAMRGGPENAGRIQAASLEYRRALEAVRKAARRLAEFEEQAPEGGASD